METEIITETTTIFVKPKEPAHNPKGLGWKKRGYHGRFVHRRFTTEEVASAICGLLCLVIIAMASYVIGVNDSITHIEAVSPISNTK
jgi:hypothetical protein